MTKFDPGTKGLNVYVCSRYQGLLRVLRIWVLGFVLGTHFRVTTSTRSFEKNLIFKVKKKVFEFFLMFLGSKHIKNFPTVIRSLSINPMTNRVMFGRYF